LIDDRKDSGVAADADGQHKDYSERKTWAAPETPSSVSDLPNHSFRKAHRSLVSTACRARRFHGVAVHRAPIIVRRPIAMAAALRSFPRSEQEACLWVSGYSHLLGLRDTA
jgi:hypothetical protein